ncbi:MAG: hypothetical protein ACRDNZ_04220 [Streptosporangiaceae bacterium]
MNIQSPEPGARLAQLRARYPLWTIARAEGRTIGYTATKGSQQLHGVHLGALAAKLADAEAGGQP